MNKATLIEHISKSAKLSKADAKRALESMLKAISTGLKASKKIVLTGFGTFSVVKRKARKGVNPATGKSMNIAARKVAKFKPGKALKDLVS